jgi:hypothetical protein
MEIHHYNTRKKHLNTSIIDLPKNIEKEKSRILSKEIIRLKNLYNELQYNHKEEIESLKRKNTEAMNRYYEAREMEFIRIRNENNLLKVGLQNQKQLIDSIYELYEDGKKSCGICCDSIKKNNLVVTKCSHYFCKTCLGSWMNIENSRRNCPICRMQSYI